MAKARRSMRRAIDEKCKDCIFDSCVPGTWRAQTEACDITHCPLWPYRPQTTKKAKKTSKEGDSCGV